jgi:hypothetical protein
MGQFTSSVFICAYPRHPRFSLFVFAQVNNPCLCGSDPYFSSFFVSFASFVVLKIWFRPKAGPGVIRGQHKRQIKIFRSTRLQVGYCRKFPHLVLFDEVPPAVSGLPPVAAQSMIEGW